MLLLLFFVVIVVAPELNEKNSKFLERICTIQVEDTDLFGVEPPGFQIDFVSPLEFSEVSPWLKKLISLAIDVLIKKGVNSHSYKKHDFMIFFCYCVYKENIKTCQENKEIEKSNL